MTIRFLSEYIDSKLQIVKDDLSISLKQLKKQLFYQEKKSYYKTLLEGLEKRENPFFLQNLLGSFFSLLNLSEIDQEGQIRKEEKKEILKRLITLTDNLERNPESKIHVLEYKKLNKQLEKYLDIFDHFLTNDPILTNDPNFYELVELKAYDKKINFIKKLLSRIVKKIKFKYVRDLRQFLRKVIKYLIKQQEDESFKKNEFKMIGSNSFFLKVNLLINGYQTYPRYVRGNL